MADSGVQPAPVAAPGADEDVQRFLRRYKEAASVRDRVASIIDECYEFALPLRERTYMDAGGAARRTDRLFDATAPEALQALASQVFDDVWPADAQPFQLLPGPLIDSASHDDAARALAEVADDIIQTINASNFEAEAEEMLQDWAIATGIMLVEPGDAIDPLRNTCIPLSQAVLDIGPFKQIDALFRPREVKARDVRTVWPGAKINADLRAKELGQPDGKIKFVEGVERDWKARGTETWRYRVCTEDGALVVLEGVYEGFGSQPFVAPSFMRVAGEVLGRGPVQIALPDIKTINLVKELDLEYADLHIGGMWQADDDGVVNVDTISIAAGTIIRKAPGSQGLQPVQLPGDFQLAQVLVKDLRESIRSILLWNDLGPLDQTPRSATEILQRSSDRAKRQRGPKSRLLKEFVAKYVLRVAHIRRQQGGIARGVPPIDGRHVILRPLSPLTRSQAQDDILRNDRFVEMLNARFGPQMTGLLVDEMKYGEMLAKKFGIDPELIRTQAERNQIAKAIAAAAQQSNAQPPGPAPVAPLPAAQGGPQG